MKLVIAGSASLENEIQEWVKYWNNQEDCSVLNYPKTIPIDQFEELYPDVHKNFFKDINEADILFIANEKKNGINGYIGAETFAELSFGLAKKLIEGKDIRLILAHMPAKEVACYDEIMLWNKLGWIDQIID
ncbi:MAG: hypothetical protein ACD_12C00450G0003 [uncultured bacterium]|nr:MAG: hypothetical protein ACD_12C00450G0003 [uncultured bacterium]